MRNTYQAITETQTTEKHCDKILSSCAESWLLNKDYVRKINKF